MLGQKVKEGPLTKEATQRWRAKNRDHLNTWTRLDRAEKKKRVLDHYGGRCELCDLKDDEVMTIDHIWDDGAEHRKIVPASQILHWLIKNNFPPGFRILCFNCNHKAHQACKEGKTVPISLRTLQREISTWASQQFPERDATSVWNKLGDELREWGDNPDDAAELADCIILILDWCHLKGVDMQLAVNRKMGVNINRQWIFDKTHRTWSHVK